MGNSEMKNTQDHKRRKDTYTNDDLYVNTNKRKKNKEGRPGADKESTSNIIKVRVILATLILLIILVIILIVITSFMVKYYLAMSEEMSHLKNHNLSVIEEMLHLKNHNDQQQKALESVKTFKMDFGNILPSCSDDGWYTNGCSYYYVSEETKTWDEARDKCSQMKSVLVMIKDKAEADTLKKLYNMNSRYWIGMRRDSKEDQTLKWLDGTQVSYK
ncbi:C-type lectin domain family 2 member D3-like [Dendropsophus ebraccatus]|uniref:C-type lectin domain family 2 member D3-like n=1 Tax=Dendropsophus ebraccatus TaxID=150705 RepID=UPI003831A441